MLAWLCSQRELQCHKHISRIRKLIKYNIGRYLYYYLIVWIVQGIIWRLNYSIDFPEDPTTQCNILVIFGSRSTLNSSPTFLLPSLVPFLILASCWKFIRILEFCKFVRVLNRNLRIDEGRSGVLQRLLLLKVQVCPDLIMLIVATLSGDQN